jgi:uncharacterized membrane protein
VTTNILVILAGAFLTYLTRAGGHLVLSRFERVHPRVEAALNAVPAAVLTTLVAPAAWEAGPVELAALAVAAGVALFTSGVLAMFIAGAAVLALGQFI